MKYEIWDPFEELERFRKEMDKIFNNFGSISLPKEVRLREPLMDIIDKKNSLDVIVEIPGVDKKDIKISVEENTVEIKAEKKKSKEEKKKNFYRQERVYQGFYKKFSLPVKVNPDKSKVKFDNGILTLKLIKAKKLPHKKKVLSLK